ncbi:MAG: hypothetical protein HYX59_15345 [Elusimicrobia bacterium]|nr:hypothetical protein [Elusimicrobiota bacterium]
MDPKTQMPNIKAEVLKSDDGKKKGAGLLGLFGGGGGGAAGGLGGLGAGAAGGTGLLATKAGMLALVLMGSAVAGGIGLAGYKMFGPGEADRTGGNLSLFQPKPTQAASDAVAPVAADGSSASLGMMAQAAAKDKEADASASASASAEAPTDKTAGDPAKDAAAADAARREAAARAASGGAINSGGGDGAVGSMNRGLTNTKKLGALSGSAGGGGASTTAGSGTVGKLGDGLANAARNGQSGGFSKSGPGAKASSARGVAARGGRGARAQARAVMGDQQLGRAGSSFAAGRTYDGSATQAGGNIGGGTGIGLDGVGDGAGAQPKALPRNSAPNSREEENIPTPPAKDVTPWAKEMMMGLAAGAVAVALLMWASSLITTAKTTLMNSSLAFPAAMAAFQASMQLIRLLIGGAIAIALAGVALGAMIAGGKNGQSLQGGLLVASSAAIAAAGTGLMMSTLNPLPKDGASLKSDETLAAFGSPGTWIYIIGGLGAVGLVGSMLAPKKTCKSDQEGCHAYHQQQISPTNYTV